MASLARPWPFFLFVIGFALFGLLMIYDASVPESLLTFGHPWYYALRHAVWVVLGIGIFTIASFVPRSILKQLAPLIFFGAVVLLVAVLIPGIGSRLQGAQRWILLGPIPLQPAEISKLAVILFFSSWLEKHQRTGPFLFFTCLVTGLVLLQPNMSTTVLLGGIATTLYFLAGGKMKFLSVFGAIAVVLIGILILAAPYRRDRLMTFLNPASDPLGNSYHIRQITLALGRGGVMGQGIGLSKQKQQYIPEAANDSIFAIYAEETGYVGSLVLLGAFGLLLATGWYIATIQPDTFSFLVAAGITTWLGLQILFNLAAMVALMPLTGVPLPLISYGGSALLSVMAGLGILLGLLRSAQESPKATRKPKKLLRRL
jgi:cell division protein FtsW